MTGRNDIELYRGDQTVAATIRWWTENGDHTVELSSDLGVQTASAWSALHALNEIRGGLEPDGWLVGVNGARRDAAASGMALDMGGGLSVYVHDTEPPRLVDTFGRAERTEVATLAEQEDWLARRRTSSPRPEVTDEMRRQAAVNPGAWLYAIAAGFDPLGEVPPEAIKGAYWVDESGQITDRYEANKRYRPTPAERGMPQPITKAEDVAQKVATGWADKRDLLSVLRQSEVYVGPARAGGIEIYTSIEHVPGYVEEPTKSAFAAFVDDWDPDTDVVVNPISHGTVRLDGRLVSSA